MFQHVAVFCCAVRSCDQKPGSSHSRSQALRCLKHHPVAAPAASLVTSPDRNHPASPADHAPTAMWSVSPVHAQRTRREARVPARPLALITFQAETRPRRQTEPRGVTSDSAGVTGRVHVRQRSRQSPGQPLPFHRQRLPGHRHCGAARGAAHAEGAGRSWPRLLGQAFPQAEPVLRQSLFTSVVRGRNPEQSGVTVYWCDGVLV
jgi:hypothetical protein